MSTRRTPVSATSTGVGSGHNRLQVVLAAGERERERGRRQADATAVAIYSKNDYLPGKRKPLISGQDTPDTKYALRRSNLRDQIGLATMALNNGWDRAINIYMTTAGDSFESFFRDFEWYEPQSLEMLEYGRSGLPPPGFAELLPVPFFFLELTDLRNVLMSENNHPFNEVYKELVASDLLLWRDTSFNGRGVPSDVARDVVACAPMPIFPKLDPENIEITTPVVNHVSAMLFRFFHINGTTNNAEAKGMWMKMMGRLTAALLAGSRQINSLLPLPPFIPDASMLAVEPLRRFEDFYLSNRLTHPAFQDDGGQPVQMTVFHGTRLQDLQRPTTGVLLAADIKRAADAFFFRAGARFLSTSRDPGIAQDFATREDGQPVIFAMILDSSVQAVAIETTLADNWYCQKDEHEMLLAPGNAYKYETSSVVANPENSALPLVIVVVRVSYRVTYVDGVVPVHHNLDFLPAYMTDAEQRSQAERDRLVLPEAARPNRSDPHFTVPLPFYGQVRAL